jgi:hypothetical protein
VPGFRGERSCNRQDGRRGGLFFCNRRRSPTRPDGRFAWFERSGTRDAEHPTEVPDRSSGPKFHPPSRRSVAEGSTMKDLIFIAISAAFFAVSWLYALSFDRI